MEKSVEKGGNLRSYYAIRFLLTSVIGRNNLATVLGGNHAESSGAEMAGE